MNRLSIKYKLLILIGIPLLGFLYYFQFLRDLFSVVGDFYNYRCYECKTIIKDPTKLMKHIQLGCFDVHSSE